MHHKRSKVLYYADECIPVPVVSHLKSRGFSIVHALDFNNLGKSDLFQSRVAQKKGRVLISLDKDFNRYKEMEMTNHPGIILITVGSVTSEHINKVLDKGLKCISRDYARESILRMSINQIVKIKLGKEYKKLI